MEEPSTQDESLREGEMLYNLLRSDDWKLAYGILESLISELDSISSIDDIENKDFGQLGQVTATRAGAIEIVRSWLTDLENRAGNFASIVIAEADDDDYVKRR